jgi:hypothetical protein
MKLQIFERLKVVMLYKYGMNFLTCSETVNFATLRGVTSQQKAFFVTSEYGDSFSCCTFELVCPQRYVYAVCFLHMNTFCVSVTNKIKSIVTHLL